MSEVKLVLSDLDGTMAMPEGHAVTERVQESVLALEQQGIALCAVTGRTFEMARKLLTSLGITHPSIFHGGAAIQDPVTGEVLWSKPIETEQIARIVEILRPFDNVRAFGTDLTIEQPKPIDQYDEGELHIFSSVKYEDTPKVLELLRDVPGIVAHANRGPGGDMSMYGVQITHAEADKYHGALQLLKMNRTDAQHTFAIGDGDNDLPLFSVAARSAAMGNASDLLKSRATYVVGDVQHDGFAEAMEKYVLPR